MPALRYAGTPTAATDGARSDEIAHLRLRYKLPQGSASRLVEAPILRDQLQAAPSESLRFATAVAGFADALRGGMRMDGWSLDAIAAMARGARGEDRGGQRAEFVQLVEAARGMQATPTAAVAD